MQTWTELRAYLCEVHADADCAMDIAQEERPGISM